MIILRNINLKIIGPYTGYVILEGNFRYQREVNDIIDKYIIIFIDEYHVVIYFNITNLSGVKFYFVDVFEITLVHHV